MPTSETRGIDAHSPHRRRKWSKDHPPTMRIVLLGKSLSKNSRVGNFILGRAAFDSEAPPDVVERVGGRLKDRHVILINSPQLLQTHISDHLITQSVRECVSLSDPGPHVIVLILKHEQCSAEDQECVEKVLDSFSERVYQHTMVLTTQEPTETNDILQKIIQKCCNRLFSLQGNSSPDDLLQMFEDIVQMNDGRHLDCAEASQKLLMNQHATERFSGGVKLNLVVCGSNRTLKSSISERILQQTDRRSDGDLHGRVISVVELPALFNTRLSEEEVMRRTLRCVYLCDPGVHVFLLIVPDAPLTDEDKAEMEEIQRIFGTRIKQHIMILIMQNSEHQTAELNEETKTVIESFGGRHHLFGPSTQVSALMENIEQMLEENSGEFFSSESFLEDIWRKCEEMKKKINSLETQLLPQGSTGSEYDLRIVLLGKTGVGKSETGNTILGRQAFKAEESFESVTTESQRETSEINGRRVTVIDTPGLFDTELSNEEIQREIRHCISMILPGPHVFLLLIPLGRFTKEEQESVKIIQEMFGEKSLMFTIVLFTRGDFLKNKTIEQCLGKPGSVIRNLTEVCGNRYHVFNNNQTGDRTQVSDLLEKIDNMVNANGGSFYSCKMFRQMEREKQEQQMKILMDREREELMKKHEEEKERIKIMLKKERQNYEKERKRREEEFREREEQYKKEIKEHEMQMRDTMSREREGYEKQKLTATSAAIFGEIICQKLKEPIEQSVYKKTARDLTYEIMKNCESLNGNRSNLEKHILKTLAEEEDFDKYANYIHNPRDHYKSFIRTEVSQYITDKFSVSVLPKMKENIKLLQQKIMKAAHESTEHVQEYKGDVCLWLKSFTQQLSDVLIFSVKDLRAVKHDDVDVKLLEDVIREELPTIMSKISKTLNEKTFPVKLEYKERPDELLIGHFCQCCWVQCPFCGATCTNNIGNHHGDHSVPFHRNIGLNKKYYRSTSNLSTHICTSAVTSKTLYFHPNDSDNTVLYREYRRAGGVYAKWSITPDLSELPYWKWFVCRFQKDLEKYYNKTFDRSGKILDEWRKYSKQDAIKSLGRYI